MKKATKLLAFIMSVVMLFSVMSVGMSGIVSLAAQEITVSSTTTVDENVVIVVPETIYLTPSTTSSKTGQKFVNNTLSSDGKTVTTDTDASSTGKMYFYIPGAQTVNITTKTLSGGAATFGNLDSSYAVNGTAYKAVTNLGLTLGTALAAGQSVTIEWKFDVTYQNGTTATYYAYSVAYSPFSLPVVISIMTYRNNILQTRYASTLTWISGVHSFATHSKGHDVDKGLKYIYISGSKYIAPLLTSSPGFITGNGKNGPDNWWNASSGSNTAPQATVFHSEHDSIKSTSGIVKEYVDTYLSVDTSRYTNLNQIPNLTYGFMATDFEGGSGRASFYLSDFTDTNSGVGCNYNDVGKTENPDDWTAKGSVWYNKDSVSASSDYYHYGTWDRDNIDTDDKNLYIIKSAAKNRYNDKESPYAMAYIRLNVDKADKSDLRELVLQCTSLNQSNYASEYWTDTASTTKRFYEALKDAGAALGDPQAGYETVTNAYNTLVAAAKELRTIVTFDATTNGGTLAGELSQRIKCEGDGFSRTVTLSKTLLANLYALNAPVKSGYKFIGWSTVPDVTVNNGVLDTTNISVFDSSAKTFSKDIQLSLNSKLYAIFAKDITVTFNHLSAGGGSTTTKQTAQVYNREATANITPFEASDVGEYVFTGWANSGSDTVSSGSVDVLLSGVTADKTLYATYKKTVTLNFNLNDGTLNNLVPLTGDILYNYNLATNTTFATIQLPAEAPVKTGYTFDGWNIDGNLYSAGASAAVYNNTTADASWTINKYTVTFNYKDKSGTDKQSTQSVEYNALPAIPSNFSGNYALLNETQHYKLVSWDKSPLTTQIKDATTFTATYITEDHTFTSVTVDKTCTTDGSTTYTCTGCGYTYSETIPASHEWGEWIEVPATCYKEGYRYHVCGDCQASETDPTYSTEKIAHTYNGHERYEAADGVHYYHYCTVCASQVANEEDRPSDWRQDCVFTSEVTDPARCEHAGTTTWTCETCGEQYTTSIPALVHDYVGVVTAPTCTKQGYTTWTCSKCNDSYIANEVSATGHTYGNWTHTGDTSKHSKTCIKDDCDKGTDYIIYADHRMTVTATVPSTCQDHGYDTYTCLDGCGYTYNVELTLASHTPDENADIIIAPTCTQGGKASGSCAVCGQSLGQYDVDALGHDYSAWTDDGNDLTHTHVCSRCDSTEPGHSETKEHDWNDGVITVPATCESNSVTTFTCLTCSAEKDVENSDAHGHNYVPAITAPTCIAGGYTTYTCSHDSTHTYVTDYTDPVGHAWDLGTVTVPATCKSEGLRTYTCSVCGETKTTVIPITGHPWSAGTQTKAPTCSEPGIKEYVCTYCGEKKTEEIPMLTHVYTTTVVVATCTTDGYTTYTCKNCDYSYDGNFVIHKGHRYTPVIIAPTCTAQGYTTYTCQVCFNSYRDDYVDATGHDMQDIVTDPTCTKQGFTTHTCQTCGYHYNDTFTAALKHDYSIIAVIDPTCTEQGYTNHTCSRCDVSYRTDFVPAVGHNYILKDTVLPGTTVNGYYLFECTECQDSYKETIYSGGKALVCFTLLDSNGSAVPNATLVVTRIATGETETITTDANGYFTWIFPEGEFSVSITKLGYTDTVGTIIVSDGEAEIDIPAMPRVNCSCLCHADSFWGKIYRLLIKMFSIFGKIECCPDNDIWN